MGSVYEGRVLNPSFRLSRELGWSAQGSFNPLGSDPEESKRFREVVSEFQKKVKMTHCKKGILCARTVAQIQRMLRLRSSSLNSGRSFERGMTL